MVTGGGEGRLFNFDGVQKISRHAYGAIAVLERTPVIKFNSFQTKKLGIIQTRQQKVNISVTSSAILPIAGSPWYTLMLLEHYQLAPGGVCTTPKLALQGGAQRSKYMNP